MPVVTAAAAGTTDNASFVPIASACALACLWHAYQCCPTKTTLPTK